MEESLQEENDNEDMEICYDHDNVEMNAGASDGNDEEVKASDDDDNSDGCQRTIIKPFNIEEDQITIIKEYFIGKSDVSSHFLRMIKMKKWLTYLEIYLGCMIVIHTLDIRYQTQKLMVYFTILLI